MKVAQVGRWLGATVVLVPDKTGLGIDAVPVPQVAFRWRGTTNWNFLLEKEFDNEEVVGPYRGAKPGTLEIRLMGPHQTDQERLVEKLKRVDIKFVQEGNFDAPIAADGTVKLAITSQVDAIVFRTVAKIALNYVAHQRGIGLVLKSDFDEARRYVRYGTEPFWGTMVQLSREPILLDDSVHSRQTNGHLVTFDWNSIRSGFLAQVSLFNSMTYRVAICPNYSGIWHDGMRIGHHFNIEERRISRLRASSLAVAR